MARQRLTQEEFREKLPRVVDKWKKNRDKESLVWLYEKAVERCDLKTRKDVVEIFGDPDWEETRIFGYDATDGFYVVSFETEDDDAKTIIAWRRQP